MLDPRDAARIDGEGSTRACAVLASKSSEAIDRMNHTLASQEGRVHRSVHTCEHRGTSRGRCRNSEIH
eukprot:7077557-Prymnesium_polylepis.1